MTDIEQIVDNMTDDEAEFYGRWHAMMVSAFEIGTLAQKQLLVAGMLRPSERLFLTRKERRQLTSIQ